MCLQSEDVNAEANYSITGDTEDVAVSKTMTYAIEFYESGTFDTLAITYVATLTNSAGDAQSSAVSPSSGSLTNGVPTDLTITAPAESGHYTLTVVFSETIDDATTATTYTATKDVYVIDPITLSVVLTNTGTVDCDGLIVVFYVDGELIEDSDTEVTVVAGEKTTVTYDWVVRNLSGGSHTFSVEASSDALVSVSGLGEEFTFYNGHSDYSLMTIIMGIFCVILVVVLIYIYRKPVKNYGKPKARR